VIRFLDNVQIPPQGRPTERREVMNQFHFLLATARGRSCIVFRCDEARIAHEKLRGMIDLDQINTSYKRLARSSLLLSCVTTTNIRPLSIGGIRTQDIERSGYNFTDGCGRIGIVLARQILQNAGLLSASHLNEQSLINRMNEKEMLLPTVLQIRFLGCKGIVILSTQIAQSDIEIRDSMWKFEVPDPAIKTILGTICLVDISRSYEYGRCEISVPSNLTWHAVTFPMLTLAVCIASLF
jgi:hypothetical protein